MAGINTEVNGLKYENYGYANGNNFTNCNLFSWHFSRFSNRKKVLQVRYRNFKRTTQMRVDTMYLPSFFYDIFGLFIY